MVSESDEHSGLLVLTGWTGSSHVSEDHVTYGEGQSSVDVLLNHMFRPCRAEG